MTIENCHVAGSVSGTEEGVGGLIGDLSSSNVSNSSFSGDVTSSGMGVGGLVGYVLSSEIKNCYSAGSIDAHDRVGGLAGYVTDSSIISNSYSSADVSDGGHVAFGASGFVGCLYNNSKILNCYSLGQVDTRVGIAFCPVDTYSGDDSTIENCYFVEQNIDDLASQPYATGKTQDWFSDVNNIKSILGDDGTWDYSTFSNGTVRLVGEPSIPIEPTIPAYPQGALIFQIGTDGTNLSTISVDTQFSLDELNFDVTDTDSARNVIIKCDEILAKINEKRANIGANTNIINSIVQGNSITKENLSASNSRITDADIAKESANMVKNQILQNTASALLSQSQAMDGGLLLRLLGM